MFEIYLQIIKMFTKQNKYLKRCYNNNNDDDDDTKYHINLHCNLSFLYENVEWVINRELGISRTGLLQKKKTNTYDY